ncbi:MAG: permease-like cell division protein FtsX [Calditrichaeota bacterium]|nr:permease-like cell division protein FtsX [Calditrichota bacterium]
MFWFSLSEGFKNLIRSRYTGLITTLSMIVSLLLVSSVATIAYSIRIKLKELQNQTTMMVFFDQNLSEKAASEISDKIAKFNLVKSVRFISKTEGLKEFYQKSGGQNSEEVNKILGYNPLPHTAMIFIEDEQLDKTDFGELRKEINKLDSKAEIVVKTEEIQKRSRYIDYLIKGGSVVALVIITITIVLIFNTIRLSIHSKQTIITTMRLVGARDSLIKRPFVFEAILQSIFSAIVVAAITYFGIDWLNQHIDLIDTILGRSLIYHRFHFYALLVLAVAMAMIGSWFSIRKYLKFKIKRAR